MLFHISPKEQQKIAIIGAGAMGISIASILARLELAEVTIFEAESKPFNSKSASTNNTGILHHFIYGGHRNTLEILFKQAIVFRKLMPDYVFGDNQINYLVLNEPNNTAIHRKGVTFKEVATFLKNIYQNHLIKHPDDNFFGQAEEIVKIIDEENIDYFLNSLGLSINLDKNLVNRSTKKTFLGAVQVKQPVLNMGEYCTHMINLLDLLLHDNLLSFQGNTRVKNICIKDQGFELKIKNSNQLSFDTVINAGYGGGLEIPSPSLQGEIQKEGNIARLKVYGLYKIPQWLKLQIPGLAESFSSTLLIRGQYGGIIKVGYDFLAMFYGPEYNQAELHFPIDTNFNHFPEQWHKNLPQIMGRSEKEMMKAIKNGISRWIPWAKELEDVKLKKAVQVYPGRQPANDLEAAKRDDDPVRYRYKHQNGGEYIHITGSKLTSIPYNSFKIVREILSIYIAKGILTQEQVNQHIAIDESHEITISPQIEYALGKDLPQMDSSEREKIIQEWNVY